MGINNFLRLLIREKESLAVVGNPDWKDWCLYRERHEVTVIGESRIESDIWEDFEKEKKESHKYVVLRDKATGALTFFFVLNYPDRDVGSLAMYARVACMSNQLNVQAGDGQLEVAVTAIENERQSREQFDWIGYGHFWLNTFEGKGQLRLDYNYPALNHESEPYWHEGLSEVVRDRLANLFGVYVAMDFTLRRQSAPRQPSKVEV